MTRWLLLIVLTLTGASQAQTFEFEDGDRILVIGNTFAERMAESGYLHSVMQARHPGMDITVRAVPWSADEVALQPRETKVPTTQDWIDRLDPDVVFMFYGMAESFRGLGYVDEFQTDLATLIDQVRAREDGERRVVLFSPIGHEDLGAPWASSEDVAAHNEVLSAYVDAMGTVAQDKGVRFVNFLDMAGGRRLTTNGIHPSEQGSAGFAMFIDESLGWRDLTPVEPTEEEIETARRLRLLACDLHSMERLRYRPTNTEYVWGRRHEPFGVVNFPAEEAQLDRMIEARQRAIWALEPVSVEAILATHGERTMWETLPSLEVSLADDEWTPDPVEAKGTETSLGDTNIKDPEAFAEAFTLPDGYVIECFASEQDFEELASPVALTFDSRGRLWVLCITTYPHLLPGEQPRCKLLILEDTDGDGRADSRTVFADRLYIPTGFAVDTDAVYIGQAPDLLRLRDLDGDDVADTREVVLTGFAMPDSHHQISAFEWMPGGGFIMNEGVFSKTNIETPYGVRRARDAAVWKFDPRTERLEALSHCGFANPWGHAYNDYGLSVLADASGGANFAFSHVIHAFDYPRKPGRPGHILNRGRPTAGCELISSRHFPEDVQDTFLVNQSIGYHGTRWDRLIPDGSSWRTENMPQDLIECSDTNFRPVAMEIGPDGALYIVDWCNPIIGHMQYSVRDPRRDSSHGRIWRVRYEANDLLEAPNVADATVVELLDLLRLPERNTRQLARRRIQTADPDELFPILADWIADIDPNDTLRDRMYLEGLWILQAHGVVDLELASRVIGLYEPEARAGGVRVLRHWVQSEAVEPGDVAELLLAAAGDDDMRVRLEAVSAAGFMPGDDGVRIITAATEHEMDGPMSIVLRETITHLAPEGESTPALVRRIQLDAMAPEKLGEQEMDEVVAGVIIARDDMPSEARQDALMMLGGAEPSSQAAALAELLAAASTRRHVEAIGTMLLAMPDEALAPIADSLPRDQHSGRQAIRTAVLLRCDQPVDDAGAVTLVKALEYLSEGEAPADALARVRHDVESSVVDPTPAIDQLVRHEANQEALFLWLRSLVDAVEGAHLAEWTTDHERAMAALRGLNAMGHWPEGSEAYQIADASASYERGEAIYHDEAIGCVRCHAEDGSGLEGFPPLDRSPWIVGDPARAASIVVHGLQGPIRVGDDDFNSAMAPLGALLTDEQVADVVTYVRQSWGNYAAPATVEDVARARQDSPRSGIWTVSALADTHPLEQDGLVVKPAAAALATGGSGTKRVPMPVMILGFLGAVAITAVMALVLSRVAKATS